MNSICRFSLLTCLLALNAIGCDAGPIPGEEMELSTLSSAISQDFARRFVDAHNNARGKHGAQPITWDAGLASSAQQYANRCLIDRHSPESEYLGENLASGWGGGMSTPEQAVALWYQEINDYDFSNPGYPRQAGRKIGHFTQVVWNASKAVGCGQAKCGNNDFFVCQYSPKGNDAGKYAQNVFPEGGGIGTGHRYSCSIRNGSGAVAGSILVNKCFRVGDTNGNQMLNCDYVYNLLFNVPGTLRLTGHISSMKAQIIDQASGQVAEEGRAIFNDRESSFTVEFTTKGPKHQSYFTFPTYWDCRRS